MTGKTFGYARVSTREQNLDRQLSALLAYGVGERDIITDKESGQNMERGGYMSLKNHILRSGDVLVVKSLDRLSRNKSDIREELEHFKNQGIRLKVLDLPTTLTDVAEGQEWVLEMVNNIIIEVLGTMAEQERETLRRRQAEGIAAAKARGAALGRPKAEFPGNWSEVIQLWESEKITAVKAMNLMNMKRTTFYKLVRLSAEGEIEE
jgi:DNA invertase Pin-like site-specific DNA recombinase